MAFRRIPPPLGTLKVNVHGVFSSVSFPNGNNHGIGAIYRTRSGVLRHISVAVLPKFSLLGNQLWAIYAPMRRAFTLGYKSMIIETDNYDAFKAVREFSALTPTPIFDLVELIDTLRRNETWTCSVAFVFPARNLVARYTAKLRMEVGDMLYTLDRPVGAIEELIDWDLGIGVDHPDFMDVHLVANAPDPVNFDGGMTLADDMENLGLGQENAPVMIVVDREEHELMLEGVMEQTIHSSNFDAGMLFADEPPLDGID